MIRFERYIVTSSIMLHSSGVTRLSCRTNIAAPPDCRYLRRRPDMPVIAAQSPFTFIKKTA